MGPRTIQSAISALNSLQSNAALLDAVRKSGNLVNMQALDEFRGFLQRIGRKAADFDRLAIIHIAGTKGKGSTSAFCDSILRQARVANGDGTFRPLRTGLYTSPHLQEVRERIRINGAPVSKDLFAKHFFSVWDKLEATKPAGLAPGDNSDKPFYFRYLTLMSLQLFLEENVDVVILEVGIGGELDSTNVIEKPVVCGITSLGFDHVAILGSTIDKIAWHKAGIIKPGVPVATSPQLPDAIATIRERAKERKASKLIEVTEAEADALKHLKLGLSGAHQRTNAALARRICQEWIASREADGVVFQKDATMIERGLELASWPGRCQRTTTAEFPDIEWFMDGAHTPESLQVCADWFRDTMAAEASAGEQPPPTYLVFNCTHGRDGQRLLPPLVDVFATLPLAKAVFTTNSPFAPNSTRQASDLINNMVHPDPEHKAQQDLARAWSELAAQRPGTPAARAGTLVAGSVEEAVQAIEADAPGRRKCILVTGSLHLVGSLMTLLKTEVV
ncbi:Folylpolyglutamate synthetase [Polyrhizophydium stewartii]|uniref:Folylpolyglutamate synthase n=1 Tax=Polyrhizophydium stewartii TaxID=2732419 RepID=A0ABR4N134_9FUNG